MSESDWTKWAVKAPATLVVGQLAHGAPPFGAACVWLRNRVIEVVAQVGPFLAKSFKEGNPSAPPQQATEAMLGPIVSVLFEEWVASRPLTETVDAQATVQAFAQFVANAVMHQATHAARTTRQAAQGSTLPERSSLN